MKKSLLALFLTFSMLTGIFTNACAQDEVDKDFESFLEKFTSSTEFQYSRIKFPITTPIVLLGDNGEELEVPFTADEWPLLEAKDFIEGRHESDEGILFGRYTKKEDDQVVFETGLEESELDLIITFDKVDGKWYVTDCYNGWYGSLYASDFDATVYEVQQRNTDFAEKNP